MACAVAVTAGAAVVACGGGGDGLAVAPPSTANAPAAFQMNITSTTDVPGTFGGVGAYQQIKGTFVGEVDPSDATNGPRWPSRIST